MDPEAQQGRRLPQHNRTFDNGQLERQSGGLEQRIGDDLYGMARPL
jgi:hypothetical protein